MTDSFPKTTITVELGEKTILYLHIQTFPLDERNIAGRQRLVSFELSNEDGIRYERAERIIHHIQNFLTLATLEPTRLISLNVNADPSFQTYPHSVSIFRVGGYYPDKISTALLGKMLFTLKEIQEEFPDLLANWIRRGEECRLPYYMYFAVTNSKGMYEEHKFLAYIQSIEGMHEILIKKKKIIVTKDKERKITAKLSDYIKSNLFLDIDVNISPDEQTIISEVLCDSLKYANKLPLKSKIQDLLSNFSEDVICKYWRSRSEISSFCDAVVKLRNHFSHGSAKESAELSNIGDYAEQLQILLEYCLLSLMDMKNDKIMKLLKYRWY